MDHIKGPGVPDWVQDAELAAFGALVDPIVARATDPRPAERTRIGSLHQRWLSVRIISMSASLQVLPDTFTTATARGRGVHPRDLYAWRDSGEVVELSRGVFRRADAEAASLPDLLAVAYRAPRAIVCCVSAAAVHGLTDELPGAVQIAVAARSHPPRIEYPPTSVFRFDEATFEVGMSHVDAAPGTRPRGDPVGTRPRRRTAGTPRATARRRHRCPASHTSREGARRTHVPSPS